MKLKESTPLTCPNIRQTNVIASVGLNMKVGTFNFNRTACDLIGLKEGDEVVFHQDEDEPTDWYVEKVKSQGFTLRVKSNNDKGAMLNNATLSRKIAESVGFNGTSGKCLIAGNPTKIKNRELWGVITSSLINL